MPLPYTEDDVSTVGFVITKSNIGIFDLDLNDDLMIALAINNRGGAEFDLDGNLMPNIPDTDNNFEYDLNGDVECRDVPIIVVTFVMDENGDIMFNV